MKMHRLITVTVCLVSLLACVAPAQAAPIDDTFAAFATYTRGSSRVAVVAVEEACYRASGDPKARAAMGARLQALLQSPTATPDAKAIACLHVPLVCDDSVVKTLVALLADAKTADSARGALQRLSGEAAGVALREALAAAGGPARIGLINSLGARRDAKAAFALATLLANSDAATTTTTAAIAALGAIGTPEAVNALASTRVPPSPAVLDALLECADQRLAAGDRAGARAIYRRMMSTFPLTAAWRWAGLTGLARTSPDDALPILLSDLGDSVRIESVARALSLIVAMPGPDVTAALAKRLKYLPASRQALLGALAQRGDRSAGPAVAKLLESDEPAVQVAAIEAIGTLGDETNIAALAKIGASGGSARAAARASLIRLPGRNVDAALLTQLAKGEAGVRVELINAAVARQADGIVPKLMGATGDKAATVRAAAYTGLARLGGQGELVARAGALASLTDAADRQGLEAMLTSIARRTDDKPGATRAVLAALKASKGETAAALLRVLTALGGPDALAAAVARLDAGEATVREAALRALTNWSEPTACTPLLKIISQSADKRARILAMRGYLRLAPMAAKPTEAFAKIGKLVKTADSKRLLLSALAASPASTDTLAMAVSMLDDADVRDEAPYAVVAIATKLAPSQPKVALAAVAKVREGKMDKDLTAKVAAVERLARRRPVRGGAGRATYSKAVVEARKKYLAAAAPKGSKLVQYLDCGVERTAGKANGLQIKSLNGANYTWAGSGSEPAGTVVFDAVDVNFDLTGLDATKHHAVGFSWWDYDQSTRAGSVFASDGKDNHALLLKATKMPSFTAGKGAAEIVVTLSKTLTSRGHVRLSFGNEATPNIVVGEVWLLESDKAIVAPAAAGGGPVPAKSKKPKSAKPQAAAGAGLPMKIVAPKDESKTNVLIVTGVDYPGHKWKLTTPVLKGLLAKDTRLEVQVLADPHQLASPILHKYDVVVMHFKDYEKPTAWTAEQPNFMKFVADGGGVVLVHFACGAWQGWDEFVKISGRVWNPKLRGHDRRGPFTVEILKPDHPITKGMKDFDTHDELYTCLDGKTPIEIIAHARSKVDKKYHPMGFVLQYGKGRVFLSPLGHDVQAFDAPSVGELFRRGTAWAAGLTPVAGK